MDLSNTRVIFPQWNAKYRPCSDGTWSDSGNILVSCSACSVCSVDVPTEYLERYRTEPVWSGYRRNHKGGIPPQKTRKTCIVRVSNCFCVPDDGTELKLGVCVWLSPVSERSSRWRWLRLESVQRLSLNAAVVSPQRGDKISGNPCPVCRDPNIIVHYQVSAVKPLCSRYTW